MSVAFRALMNEVRWRGTWGTIRAIKMNKMGTMQYFVAEDEQGNKYFENPHETYGRDRWVEYSDFKNFDSSNVSPQWHAWLHKMVDDVDAVPPAPVYGRPVTRNLSGTPQAYVPTAHRNSGKSEGAQKPKYEAWEPQGESKGKPTAGMKDVLDLKPASGWHNCLDEQPLPQPSPPFPTFQKRQATTAMLSGTDPLLALDPGPVESSAPPKCNATSKIPDALSPEENQLLEIDWPCEVGVMLSATRGGPPVRSTTFYTTVKYPHLAIDIRPKKRSEVLQAHADASSEESNDVGDVAQEHSKGQRKSPQATPRVQKPIYDRKLNQALNQSDIPRVRPEAPTQKAPEEPPKEAPIRVTMPIQRPKDNCFSQATLAEAVAILQAQYGASKNNGNIPPTCPTPFMVGSAVAPTLPSPPPFAVRFDASRVPAMAPATMCEDLMEGTDLSERPCQEVSETKKPANTSIDTPHQLHISRQFDFDMPDRQVGRRENQPERPGSGGRRGRDIQRPKKHQGRKNGRQVRGNRNRDAPRKTWGEDGRFSNNNVVQQPSVEILPQQEDGMRVDQSGKNVFERLGNFPGAAGCAASQKTQADVRLPNRSRDGQDLREWKTGKEVGRAVNDSNQDTAGSCPVPGEMLDTAHHERTVDIETAGDSSQGHHSPTGVQPDAETAAADRGSNGGGFVSVGVNMAEKRAEELRPHHGQRNISKKRGGFHGRRGNRGNHGSRGKSFHANRSGGRTGGGRGDKVGQFGLRNR